MKNVAETGRRSSATKPTLPQRTAMPAGDLVYDGEAEIDLGGHTAVDTGSKDRTLSPQAKGLRMATVAGQLVQMLQKAGVRRVYGVVGDSLNLIVDAIRRTDGIGWVHVRHEETAAF